MATATPLTTPLERHDHCPNCAVICPDVQVARQFRFHLVKLPHDDNPQWLRRFEDAIELLRYHNIDRVTICSGGRHMTLWLPTEEN